ncbi:MAG: YlbF family regulator [Firmicutes bacterium]|nr:YlbF family regulator [Bacillota bacterium]
MNVYDRAYELARALKKSDEYRALLEARARVEEDPKNKEMLLEFKKRQLKIQKERLLGREVDEAELRRLEQLSELVNLNPTLKEFLSAEFRFTRLMGDIQKILSEPLSEWLQMTEEMFGSEKE